MNISLIKTKIYMIVICVKSAPLSPIHGLFLKCFRYINITVMLFFRWGDIRYRYIFPLFISFYFFALTDETT